MNSRHLWSYRKVRAFRPPPGVELSLWINFTTGMIRAVVSRGNLTFPLVVDGGMPTASIHNVLRYAAETVLEESLLRESVRTAEAVVRLATRSEARYG